jgi:hypothetical protein
MDRSTGFARLTTASKENRMLRYAFGIFAAALVLIYLSPVVLKLKDPALSVVVIGGITMMLVDLWQSLKSKEE